MGWVDSKNFRNKQLRERGLRFQKPPRLTPVSSAEIISASKAQLSHVTHRHLPPPGDLWWFKGWTILDGFFGILWHPLRLKTIWVTNSCSIEERWKLKQIKRGWNKLLKHIRKGNCLAFTGWQWYSDTVTIDLAVQVVTKIKFSHKNIYCRVP